MDEKIIYTPQEIQRILGVTYNTVKKLASEGVFETFYLQKRLFIKRDSFDDWLYNTGGKDPIIEQEKTGIWEPKPEQEQVKKDLQEHEEIKAAEEPEIAAEVTMEKKDAKQAAKQETESASGETMKIEPWCYSVEEAARILGVAKTSMYEVIRKNNIHHVYVGRRILLPKKNFHDWLEKALSEPGKSLTR